MGEISLSQSSVGQVTPSASRRPLCVDLDGTLVKSDTLMDSLLVLVRSRPLDALLVPFWLLRGKAAVKAEVGARVSLDVRHLPYNRSVIEYLETERGEGRRLYLATGADQELASRIADHLGLFDGVLASDGKTNLTAGNKLEGLRQAFGDEGYDYIGNANPDVPLLEHAGTAMIANPAPALRARLRSRGVTVEREFDDRAPQLKAILKAVRLHQWAKNILIFVPMLLAHVLRSGAFADAAIAFVSFSLCASSTYIANDLLDIESDRRHPRKRARPFAAGDLSVASGVFTSAVLLGGSIAIAAALLPLGFLLWLFLYLVATLSYSLYFKRVVLVDVILLAGLYTVRLLAGSAATKVAISPWLAAFSIFLFLSLAMVKRFSELQNTRARGQAIANGRGYLLSDIEQLRSFGTCSAYTAVGVFLFYIREAGELGGLYQHPNWLWLIAPLLIFWLSRVWLLASRGQLDEDPVIFAVTDRVSLATGAAVAIIAALAAL
ncbi:MAG TPA: UbiA family prenyltransferase [Acidobacteriaceae bacterium]|jgi:4-hydroxybenzoate polyprenyltransferase|nr:UbiA family prenyltransferase [Acidobacteriaceae bacterium]